MRNVNLETDQEMLTALWNIPKKKKLLEEAAHVHKALGRFKTHCITITESFHAGVVVIINSLRVRKEKEEGRKEPLIKKADIRV